VGFALSAMSCLAPTEIILVLSTDVACAVVTQNGVAIALGEPGDEDSGIATTTKLCSDDGGIGTAVIVPHTIDQVVGIRVTLGIDAAADQCGPNFAGCIVARRSLRFDPHTPLTLPIELDQSCVGVPCTPYSTCVSGACVDAGVECDGSSCGIAQEAGTPDAGACQPINDVTINSDAGAAPARVALSNDGWAVAYQTKLSGVELVDAHLFQGTLNISQPTTLVASNTATSLGPFGGDGTSYAVSYGNTSSSQAFVLLTAIDGTPLTGPFAFTSYRLPHFGMPSVGAAQYATAFIQGTNDAPLLSSFSSTSNPGNNAGITATGLVEINMAKGSSSYYATTTDQTGACAIYECAYASGVPFSCKQLATASPSCMAIRVAERGKPSHIVEVQNKLTVDETYPLSPAVLGTAFQLIATRDGYRAVITTLAGGLEIASYDGTAAPVIVPQLPSGGSVLGIDAIADGPNEPGFSIVYTSIDSQQTSSVHFMHLCQ